MGYDVGLKNLPLERSGFLGDSTPFIDAESSVGLKKGQGGKMTRTQRRATTMRRTFSNSKDVRMAIQLITFSGLMLFLTGLVAETVLLR